MDWMDELLSQMAIEPHSPDLVARVQARLRARRARDLWSLRVGRIGALAAGSLGAALGWPLYGRLAPSLTASPVASLARWGALLLESPSDAVLLAARQPWEWGLAFGTGLEFTALVGLTLLAAAGSYGAVHLMTLEDHQKGVAT